MLKYFKAKLRPNERKTGLVYSDEDGSEHIYKSREIEKLQKADKKPTSKKSKILVLDLDETLIHARQQPLQYPCERIQVHYEGMNVTYYVAKRPGVDNFIQELAKTFTLFVYTSSQKEYAYAMVNFLKLRGVVKEIYHRDHCKSTQYGNIKDLNILRRSSKDLILLDDSSQQVNNQPYNSLKIKAFYGEPDDKQLERVLPVLIALADEDDVRPVHRKAFEIARKLYGKTSKKPETDKTQAIASDRVITKSHSQEEINTYDENDESEAKEIDECIDSSRIPSFDSSKLEYFNNKPKRFLRRSAWSADCLSPTVPKGKNGVVQSFEDYFS